MFTSVLCCGARKWDEDASKLDGEDEPPVLQELVEYQKQQNEVRKPPTPTLLQKLGKSACCCGGVDPAPRQSLPAAPTEVADVPQVPLAAANSERDTPLGRLSLIPGPMTGKPPQLTGEFTNSGVTGNMDQFMTDLGTSWVLRSVASGMNYGVGTQTLSASQSGNAVTLHYKGGREFKQQFIVGNGPQVTQSPAGNQKLTPLWEGAALRVHVRDANGEDKSTRWQFFEGDNLIQESCTLQGTRVRITFKPKSSETVQFPAPTNDSSENDTEKDTILGQVEGPKLSGKLRPLNGTFVNSAIEGDMNQFTKDMGTSWVLRSLAASLNYGVGTQELKASQSGNDIKLHYTGGKEYTQQFVVGSGPQITEGPGGPVKLTTRWEGASLRAHIRDAGGTDKAVRWHYFEGDNLIQESRTLQGTRVRIIYEPKEE